MKTLLLGAVTATAVLLVVRRRRAARAEQALWDQASETPVVRDLR